MNLQNITQLNIDFSTQKYISINVKQYDRNSRFILITCYNQNNFVPINNNTCFAYVRYRKADDYGVFNTCEITEDGKILIELTEQMLSTIGMSYVDLIIHEAIGLGVEISENKNGEITLIKTGENAILSTMTFCVNVHEVAFDNEKIESSYEYDALNDLLIEAKIDYQNVVRACRTSERNAKESEENAYSHMNTTNSYMNTTESYMDTTESYMNTTKEHMDTTESYMDTTKEHMDTTKSYMDTTESYMDNAESSMNNAATSEVNAKASEEASASSADWSKSYAIGGTGLREDEDIRNSEFFYDQLRRVHTGTTNGLIPMGTIKFDELATAEKEIGYMYNMSTDFTTDDTFREGAGYTYEAGTHVYYTNEGYWDCLVGMTISIASLAEVKEYLQV